MLLKRMLYVWLPKSGVFCQANQPNAPMQHGLAKPKPACYEIVMHIHLLNCLII